MHIDCPRAKSDMTPCVLRDGELAADDRGCCVGCGERIDKSAPQTGGDALREAIRKLMIRYGHCDPGDDATGLEPEMQAVRAAYIADGAQTGGGDAGERARAIADASIDARVCCDKYPACQTEAWRIALATEIEAALCSSHREGATAMREACATATRGPGGHDECDHGAGYMDGRLDAALAIEALPIPGSKTDAG